MDEIKILGIVGSLRKGAHNRFALKRRRSGLTRRAG